MVFNFMALFFPNVHFRDCDFFSRILLIQSNQFFSVVVRIYEFVLLMKHLFLSVTIGVVTEKLFFLAPWQPLLGKQILSLQSCSLSVKTIPEKWSQTDEEFFKKIRKSLSSTQLLRAQTLATGSKFSKNTLLDCYYHLSLSLSRFDLFIMFYFS